jgi:hypothetical protein
MKHMLNSKKMDTNPAVSVRSSTVDTSRWLTRTEASDFVPCSSNTLQNYERRGSLHPQYAKRVDGRGVEQTVVVYNPEELTRLMKRMKRTAAKEPGEVAARAFESFEEEKSLRRIVVELRSTPEAIEQLYEKWLDMGGSRLVITPVAKDALAAIVGSFESVTDLIERIQALKPAVPAAA